MHATPYGYVGVMAGKVWTAEELAALSPAEQDAVFDASVVSDLHDVPVEFLDQLRARFETGLAERGSRPSR